MDRQTIITVLWPLEFEEGHTEKNRTFIRTKQTHNGNI